MRSYTFVRLSGITLLLCCSPLSVFAQNTAGTQPPVIDVHVHAMDGSFPGAGPVCPNTSKFTASDPRAKEDSFGWVQEECTPKLYPAVNGDYMKDVVAEMERLNVTALVFGDPKSVQKWKDAVPTRVIQARLSATEWRPASVSL